MDYQKQGEDFLKKHNITFKAKFLKHDKYFHDDKETRDIFRITFKRDRKQFSLNFGQSLNESTGFGDNAPTPYDVLACLTKYEPEIDFNSFCAEFGYNSEPLSEYPKIKKIHNAVLKEWEKVSKFFTDEELQELQEIN